MTTRELPSVLAVLAGFGLALTSPPAQALLQCDRDGDGEVSQEEARACAELDFEQLAGDRELLTEEDLARAAGERTLPAFSDVDQDGDGSISRAEWVEFTEQRFGAATEATEGRMRAEDYTVWQEEGMRP